MPRYARAMRADCGLLPWDNGEDYSPKPLRVVVVAVSGAMTTFIADARAIRAVPQPASPASRSRVRPSSPANRDSRHSPLGGMEATMKKQSELRTLDANALKQVRGGGNPPPQPWIVVRPGGVN